MSSFLQLGVSAVLSALYPCFVPLGGLPEVEGSPMLRPHPLVRKTGLVNQVEFLRLEAHYGMCNHCIIPWFQVPANVSAKASVSEIKRDTHS